MSPIRVRDGSGLLLWSLRSKRESKQPDLKGHIIKKPIRKELVVNKLSVNAFLFSVFGNDGSFVFNPFLPTFVDIDFFGIFSSKT
jgi:hypothetical protein